MRHSSFQRAAAVSVLVVAAALIAWGARVSHKVYEAEEDEFGLRVFHRISEKQLVEDATFSGVVRRSARLYTTYDRSEPRGKRPCPT